MAAKDKVQGEAHPGDDKDAPKDKVKKESGPMKLVIVGAVALFLAVLGAQVAAPILTKMIAGDPSAPAKKAADGEAGDEQQLAAADAPPPADDAGRREADRARALRTARSAVRRELRGEERRHALRAAHAAGDGAQREVDRRDQDSTLPRSAMRSCS